MQFILLPIMTLILLGIVYQDIKYRAVTWLLFPLLAISGILYFHLPFKDLQKLIKNITLNMGFLAIQVSALWLYFSIKEKKVKKLIDEKIGLGDLLFLLAVSCFFSFPYFILFNILSLVFSLVLYLIFRNRINASSIPLAGFQSVFLLGMLVLIKMCNLNMIDSDWLL